MPVTRNTGKRLEDIRKGLNGARTLIDQLTDTGKYEKAVSELKGHFEQLEVEFKNIQGGRLELIETMKTSDAGKPKELDSESGNWYLEQRRLTRMSRGLFVLIYPLSRC
eukprot:GHVU01032413.1.p2 GENE.GHVU01032413.1~~GHVU01032413.1.p2  ORF type:complete len:109 (-),score=6.95 GHVU01032413.1:620-946(-)